ncbi:MAG: hypothetical protein ABSE90_02605 [Verrucomicrobiota bacterium]
MAAICFCWGLFLALPAAVFGQTNYYTTNGMEYAVAGSMPGDQVWPDVAVGPAGGFVVWQDNVTDGSGWGVSATRLDSNLSADPTWSDHPVNVTGTNDQENARVALLKNGGAVFVWQGGLKGYQHVYARFLSATNTWLTTTDTVVSVPTNNFQMNPVVAVLNNSNVVVAWSSYNEAGSNSMLDVYGQVFSPAGQKVGGEFLVNQFANYNQRAPALAALAGGGFVVAWVSEQERSTAPSLGTNTASSKLSGIAAMQPSVDIYARLYSGSGVPAGNEFLVNSNFSPCANPSVAAGSDGGFMVVWGARDLVNFHNGWDIFARSFTSGGVGGAIGYVNKSLYGDQYAPRVSSIGTDYLVVWTSLGQDGSREGVYGQFLHAGGAPVGGEFRVNTTTAGPQMQQAVASDGANQFVVIWTDFNGLPNSFDLFAQRYLNVNLATILPTMNAPFVWAPFTLSNGVYQPQLQVSWAAMSGVAVSNYQVYADGTNSPTALVSHATNQWTMTAAYGLKTNSTHWFQMGYVTTSGRQSSLSAATTNTTWSGLNWGGIPYEWMAAYFGGYFGGVYHTNFWPAASSPAAPGGPALLKVFQSGGSPFDSGTWLQTSLAKTSQGMFLKWNTQPGLTYQVQESTNLSSWFNFGSPRFAAGTNDSIYVGGKPAGYFQVLLLH